MIDFVNYIVESGISLGLFTILYLLLLQRETFFKTNRFFLLLTLCFSLILPLIHLKIFESKPMMLGEVTVLPYKNVLETVSVYGTSISESVVHTISTSTYLVIIYLFGVLFFATRLVIRVGQLISIVRWNEVIIENNMKLVVLKQNMTPFSFLSYVFVSEKLKQQTGWEKMLMHELEHVKQGHSLDVLVLEIIAALQWFNPFFWMLKRVVRENHEYLADQAVLKQLSTPAAYKQILLQQFIGPQISMTNNFNYSLIKKRIQMMSKIKSSKFATLKMMSGLLVAALLIIVFACEKKDAQQVPEQTSDHVVALKVDNKTVTLSGDSGEIDKLKSILADNGKYTVVTHENGDLELIEKNPASRSSKEETKSDEQVFNIVEKMPEFPGGDDALRQYIATNVKYPQEAMEKGIQGKVYVNFVVEKDGAVDRIKIVRGVDPLLDKEAVRVISQLPKWKPGEQRGEKVAVTYTVPINFALK